VRHGGSAARVTDSFRKLAEHEQEAVIAFLKTLRAPSDAVPVEIERSPGQFAQR
jgi:hypothetical protein